MLIHVLNISFIDMLLHRSYLFVLSCFIPYLLSFTFKFLYLLMFTYHHIAMLCFSYHVMSFTYSCHLSYVLCMQIPYEWIRERTECTRRYYHCTRHRSLSGGPKQGRYNDLNEIYVIDPNEASIFVNYML